MDEQNRMSNEVKAEEANERINSANESEQKVSQGNDKKPNLKNLLMLLAAIIFVVIGFSSNCLQCTFCGDDNNRMLIYASGTDENGVEYKSCVGPAGLLGFGIDSKCWATECTYIKETSGVNEFSGCLTYYNELGCISKSDVKSVGKYSSKTTCLGINCFGKKYIETVAETTQAKNQTTCLGIGCGGTGSTASLNYNNKMPRQFVKGCWGSN